MTATTNARNLRHHELRFSLITEKVLGLGSHPNMVSEVKNLSLNFKQITGRFFTLLSIFIWIVR